MNYRAAKLSRYALKNKPKISGAVHKRAAGAVFDARIWTWEQQ